MRSVESISQLFDTHGSNIPLLAQSCADAIPPLFSEPQLVYVRITLNDLDFYSPAFKTSKVKVSHSLRVPKKCSGNVEIHFADGIDAQQLEEYREKAHEITSFVAEKIKQPSISSPPPISRSTANNGTSYWPRIPLTRSGSWIHCSISHISAHPLNK